MINHIKEKKAKIVRSVSRSQGLSTNSHHIINTKHAHESNSNVLESTASQLHHLLHVYSTTVWTLVCPLMAFTNVNPTALCAQGLIRLWCTYAASHYYLPAASVGKALLSSAGGVKVNCQADL